MRRHSKKKLRLRNRLVVVITDHQKPSYHFVDENNLSPFQASQRFIASDYSRLLFGFASKIMPKSSKAPHDKSGKGSPTLAAAAPESAIPLVRLLHPCRASLHWTLSKFGSTGELF